MGRSPPASIYVVIPPLALGLLLGIRGSSRSETSAPVGGVVANLETVGR